MAMYDSIFTGGQIDKGVGRSYVPTLQSAPTTSTLTFSLEDNTINFEIGQFARVADQSEATGYKFYQLYDITESNNVKTAHWIVPRALIMSDVADLSVVAISTDTSSVCSITGAGNAGKCQTIIYTNSTGSDLVVTVPTTYTTPDGQAIELTCPDGGYCEVNYINIGGTIYARGL